MSPALSCMHRSALALALAALSGCTDGKDSADSPAPAPPTLATDIQPIFDRNCISCHAGDAPSAGLDLSAGASAHSIVGVLSTQVPTMVLIEEGSIEASYLWYKLNSTHQQFGGIGTRMPPELTLASTDLAVFEAWIGGGAD